MTDTSKLVSVSSNSSNEMLLCAHCGSPSDSLDQQPFPSSRKPDAHWICRCGNPDCGAEIIGRTPEEAIARWNRRVTHETLSDAPFLQDRATGVPGVYCIARVVNGTSEYWTGKEWAAFCGDLYFDLRRSQKAEVGETLPDTLVRWMSHDTWRCRCKSPGNINIKLCNYCGGCGTHRPEKASAQKAEVGEFCEHGYRPTFCPQCPQTDVNAQSEGDQRE